MKKVVSVGFYPPTEQEISESREIGILITEKDIVDSRYRTIIENCKRTSGHKGTPHKIEGYDDDVFKNSTVDDYIKSFPIMFNKEKGIYHN